MEMPEGAKWADKVLDILETIVKNGGFDEAEVKQWPRDIDMEKKFRHFMSQRKRAGKEDRIVSWSYEKHRYYLHLCQGRSLITGMNPRRKLDIDRTINTDIYDFDTILLMETEINMAKLNMSEFKDPSIFNFSKASFKPKWAVQILRADIWKLIDDAEPLKDG